MTEGIAFISVSFVPPRMVPPHAGKERGRELPLILD